MSLDVGLFIVTDSVKVLPEVVVVEEGEPDTVNVDGLTKIIVELVDGVPPEVT